MPKKRRLSAAALERLDRQFEETRKSLRSTAFALTRYLKANSALVRQADAFHELFSGFEEACRRELRSSSGSRS